ncbi:arginine ABC transporter substrate-binding protein [Legionella birminghamensis]|uniref:Arginine ABC transporter substrate-binding protein n=1 Tax=Legionella birminghamensis TaxID=28083 RepID=A0A378ICZ2_9GAMM|nr:transporter substrate-binding domain-containing protein [Legionella birminghamensis]KTC75340.1 arginine ABC transporter substrate-binding protein [Legionella birminghamensis]STX33108.1 arginine ABC transporter substrate-binding protein [Legionella birminghamensis]
MKKFALAILLLFSSVLQAETLTVATLPYAPPFEMAADKSDHFFGFDIDIMEEICRRIQAYCKFMPMTFEQLMVRTYTGNVNLAIAAITITDDRKESYLFSLPYLPSSGQLLTSSNSPIQNLNDLAGKQIGSEKGTIFKGLLLEKFNNNIQIKEYSTQPEIFQALGNNEIDALILDEGSSKYWSANGDFKLIGPEMKIGIGYGIMANKREQALIDRINKALLSMENDGTYVKIYSKYFDQAL